MALRKPTSEELMLLHFLIRKAEGCEVAENWPSTLTVADMNDEGMGSLQLYPDGLVVGSRTVGRRASECQFSDDDGIEVIASLNIDNAGRPYELDIWKTNFEKLKRIPPCNERRGDKIYLNNTFAKKNMPHFFPEKG